MSELGFVLWLLKEQVRELDEHKGRMALVQAMATTKQLQEFLWPNGLLDEPIHLLALCGGRG